MMMQRVCGFLLYRLTFHIFAIVALQKSFTANAVLHNCNCIVHDMHMNNKWSAVVLRYDSILQAKALLLQYVESFFFVVSVSIRRILLKAR